MGVELSVVILCYKSGSQVRPFIEETRQLLRSRLSRWEIILVANYMEGEEDPTPQIVKNIAAQDPNIKAITLPKKGMMGWDVRAGIADAQGRIISVL